MSIIKIGVVEDEAVIADHICDTLEALGYRVTEPALNYTEAIQMIEDEQPDLLLLDIQLAGKKDGIDVARKVRETYDIPFIFLTANADAATVQRAKEVNPPAYLVKPFNKEDLFASIEICLSNASQDKTAEPMDEALSETKEFAIKDSLFIKDGNNYRKVRFSDILYLKSDHVYVEVITRGKNLLVRSSMKDFLPKFDGAKFLQVHRSYAVNLDNVVGINATTLDVGTEQVPFAKNYRTQLLEMLSLSQTVRTGSYLFRTLFGAFRTLIL
ncbi:MAG: response regulator [Flavobacteriales bacterium]|nr:response regulator [Flavobacteriales bacterium]